MERDVGKTADIAFSAEVALVKTGLCAGRAGHANPHRTLRIVLVAAFGEPRRGDGVGAPRQGADPLGHGRRDLAAGQSVRADDLGRNAEDFLLDRCRVGGDGAEVPGGGAGDGGEQMGDLAAGAGLGGTQGAAAIRQQPGYPVLDCFAHSWQTS